MYEDFYEKSGSPLKTIAATVIAIAVVAGVGYLYGIGIIPHSFSEFSEIMCSILNW